MPDDFDVFLSHNNRDKPLVEEIAEQLRVRGLRVWLDEWEMRPGVPWQSRLETVVQTARAVAVFVGKAGLGPWQDLETRASLNRSTEEELAVIPVLLPGCPAPQSLPPFLKTLTWVDLRKGLTARGIARLVWGITGERPAGMRGSAPGTPALSFPRILRARWSWALGLSLLGVALLAGAWLWLRSPQKPPIYEIRVHVLDPQGRPVTGSTVRTWAGNEPHLLPDGWWEVQIPAAKVPTDGQISLWAEHEDWEGNWGSLRLNTEPNPQLDIHLKQPESWIRGRVIDGRDRALSGVRITPQDGTPGEATTGADGRFALKLMLPPERKIRLRSEYKDWTPGDDFWYTGRDGCTIVLEEK